MLVRPRLGPASSTAACTGRVANRRGATTQATATADRPEEAGPTSSPTFPCGHPPPSSSSSVATPLTSRERARSLRTQRSLACRSPSRDGGTGAGA